MSSKTRTLVVFYSIVGLICVGILYVVSLIRPTLGGAPRTEIVIDYGSERPQEWFDLEADLEGVNQSGEEVRLSDLKGKVWIASQFFAICPHCAVRNGSELRMIYDQFKDHPDFHVVCITVDPETDDVAKLRDYAGALGADESNWWFINAGDEEATHRYLEDEMKFFGIRERTDPLDIESNGRFMHDLGLLLVNRDLQVVGKWPLADARSPEAQEREPGLYEALKADMMARIQTELDRVDTEEEEEALEPAPGVEP